MRDSSDAGQFRCRTGQMQDRADTGQDGCRTTVQLKGQDRCRTGWRKDMTDTGKNGCWVSTVCLSFCSSCLNYFSYLCLFYYRVCYFRLYFHSSCFSLFGLWLCLLFLSKFCRVSNTFTDAPLVPGKYVRVSLCIFPTSA